MELILLLFLTIWCMYNIAPKIIKIILDLIYGKDSNDSVD